MSAEAIEGFVVERLQAYVADPKAELALRRSLEPLGLVVPGNGLTDLWDMLTLPNRQRLVRLLVKDLVIDQRLDTKTP